MNAFVQELWVVTLALAPWLLAGAAIAGALHVLLPPNFVRRHLRGRGGVAKAVALGVPLPLCSCGVIPAGLGLKKDGASDGSTVAFLISTPQTGVDSILVSASFLGWPFALFKVASAAVTGLVGGLIADRGPGAKTELAPSSSEPAPERTFKAAAAHAVEVLHSIWRWLVFGIVASAAIGAFVPDAWLQGISAHGTWWALVAALLVSLPLYVCATASVPIAAALVAGGFPAGAALVFLMAGPATNVATLGAVHRALGRRTMVVYLATIVVGSLALGWSFDFVLDRSVIAMPHLHGEPSAIALASTIGLGALLGWFAFEDVRRLWRVTGSAAHVDSPTQTVHVEGMTCQGCVRKLEGTLHSETTIEGVRVDLAQGRADVTGPVNRERIHELVREAGFGVVPQPDAPA